MAAWQLAFGRRFSPLREAAWRPPRPRHDLANPKVRVRLKHHAIYDEATAAVTTGLGPRRIQLAAVLLGSSEVAGLADELAESVVVAAATGTVRHGSGMARGGACPSEEA